MVVNAPDDDGNDPGDEYVCDACGVTFDSEAARKRHVDALGLID